METFFMLMGGLFVVALALLGSLWLLRRLLLCWYITRARARRRGR